MLLQGEEGVIAEAQLVRGAAAFQTNLALASVEECDGVEVGIGELQHLVAAGGAVNAGELVLPHAGLEELFCKGQVQMQEHLVVDEADAGAARVDGCRNARAGVVQSIDAVDAGDDLIDVALVGAVGMAALCGLNLAECGLTLNIVAGQITLQELIVEASGVLHRADGENLGRNVVSVVVEERHAHVGQVAVGLPAFSNSCHDCGVAVHVSHVVLPSFLGQDALGL